MAVVGFRRVSAEATEARSFRGRRYRLAWVHGLSADAASVVGAIREVSDRTARSQVGNVLFEVLAGRRFGPEQAACFVGTGALAKRRTAQRVVGALERAAGGVANGGFGATTRVESADVLLAAVERGRSVVVFSDSTVAATAAAALVARTVKVLGGQVVMRASAGIRGAGSRAWKDTVVAAQAVLLGIDAGMPGGAGALVLVCGGGFGLSASALVTERLGGAVPGAVTVGPADFGAGGSGEDSLLLALTMVARRRGVRAWEDSAADALVCDLTALAALAVLAEGQPLVGVARCAVAVGLDAGAGSAGLWSALIGPRAASGRLGVCDVVGVVVARLAAAGAVGEDGMGVAGRGALQAWALSETLPADGGVALQLHEVRQRDWEAVWRRKLVHACEFRREGEALVLRDERAPAAAAVGLAAAVSAVRTSGLVFVGRPDVDGVVCLAAGGDPGRLVDGLRDGVRSGVVRGVVRDRGAVLVNVCPSQVNAFVEMAVAACCATTSGVEEIDALVTADAALLTLGEVATRLEPCGPGNPPLRVGVVGRVERVAAVAGRHVEVEVSWKGKPLRGLVVDALEHADVPAVRAAVGWELMRRVGQVVTLVGVLQPVDGSAHTRYLVNDGWCGAGLAAGL